MARGRGGGRGGRGHGRRGGFGGHRGRFGRRHYHGRGGGGGFSNTAEAFEGVMDRMSAAPVVPKLMNGALILEGKDTEIIRNVDWFSQPVGTQFSQPMVIMQPTYQMMGQEQLMAQANLTTQEGMQQQWNQFDPQEFAEMYPQVQVQPQENSSIGWNPGQNNTADLSQQMATLQPGGQMGQGNMMQPGLMGDMQSLQFQANAMNMGLQPMITFQPSQPISQVPLVTQLHVTTVGNKTEPTGSACFWLTLISGMFLIFPLCFMCCTWWLKLVYPKYEVNPELYHSLVRFIRSSHGCRFLNLKVCDNAFNNEKARILFDGLQGTQLTAFAFENVAGNFNYAGSESDDFMVNAGLLRQLPMTVTMKWGEMVVA
jgi:hypothetical protein